MTRGCEWRHAPEAWAEIWEKSVSWVPASEEEEGWLSLARRGLAAGVARGEGVQIEKSSMKDRASLFLMSKNLLTPR